MCLLLSLELRIVHACLVSSDAWVGGWRGVVETLFGRRPRVLVSYVLSPGLMLQPCMDYIQERDSLDMATEQDDCWLRRTTDLIFREKIIVHKVTLETFPTLILNISHHNKNASARIRYASRVHFK